MTLYFLQLSSVTMDFQNTTRDFDDAYKELSSLKVKRYS